MTPERWQQIEALYHAARARPVEERDAYLTAACPDDEALRREVAHLLSQPASDEGFLAGRAVDRAADMTGAAPGTMSGRSLGGYQLQALIGVGGMGEVYRARDGKLHRSVAIKVLPHAFTSEPTRLARFEREARTLAALNHPNICAIYGFEEAERVRFLILELVDGYTLADRLAIARQRLGGAGLPQREALDFARQIARALDFAHERGIVHRDLKPANIKITADGSVKVLDFGLAKAAIGDGAGADLEALPTVTRDGTIEGAIIGTPAYMSPEQARGRPVDKRTDIWAFGCVLYEMLTGRATFSGETVADTIAKILERDPDWTALPASTPEPIRNLLFGCLAKDVRDRLRDIGDVRITIDSILSGSPSSAITRAPASGSVPIAPARHRTAWLPWALAAALAIALMVSMWSFRPQPAPTPYPSVALVPADQRLDRSGGGHLVALSRDGRQLVYVASPGLLYHRFINELEAKPIGGVAGQKGVREPAFSPKGDWIVFYSVEHGGLMKVQPTGNGQPIAICKTDLSPSGIDWARDDTILFGQWTKGLFSVNPNGGEKSLVWKSDGNEVSGPHLLPDRDHVLLTLATGNRRDRWDFAQLAVVSLSKKDVVRLPVSGSDARYVKETGHVLFAVGGTLLAATLDLTTFRTGNSTQAGVDKVSRAGGAVTGAAHFSVSDTGTLVYVPGDPPGPMVIGVFAPDHSFVREVNLPPGRYEQLRVSPDGNRVAYMKESDKTTRLYVKSIYDDTQAPEIVSPNGPIRSPAWIGSDKIAFLSERDGAISMKNADNTGPVLPVTKPVPGQSHTPESWSAKTQTLLYSVTTGTVDVSVSLMTIKRENEGWGPPQRFGTQTSSDPMSATFSPDGRLVAYTKTIDNDTTVCVERFPEGDQTKCLPQQGQDTPKHVRFQQTPVGLRMYFDPRIGDFEYVGVHTMPTLEFEQPAVPDLHWFQLLPPGFRTPYDITADGKFVGLTKPVSHKYVASVENQIAIVLHWFEQLKAKVPN
jgi:eukaryotic-like serine/threonine-protein kinase